MNDLNDLGWPPLRSLMTCRSQGSVGIRGVIIVIIQPTSSGAVHPPSKWELPENSTCVHSLSHHPSIHLYSLVHSSSSTHPFILTHPSIYPHPPIHSYIYHHSFTFTHLSVFTHPFIHLHSRIHSTHTDGTSIISHAQWEVLGGDEPGNAMQMKLLRKA